MRYRSFRTLIIFFPLLISFSCMNNSLQFEYADGNGNIYTITSSTLSYIPLKPEESSSGTYSGGSAKSIPITADEFGQISTILMKAVNNKASHISDRVMMSGAISVIDGSNKKRYVIAPGSVEQKDIESTLKEILL